LFGGDHVSASTREKPDGYTRLPWAGRPVLSQVRKRTWNQNATRWASAKRNREVVFRLPQFWSAVQLQLQRLQGSLNFQNRPLPNGGINSPLRARRTVQDDEVNSPLQLQEFAEAS